MPSKNSVKQYSEDAYYHIYNRGVNKRKIFFDEQDYQVFLALLKQHLSPQKHANKRGVIYENYSGRLDLLAFCLMPNHFHLLFYLNNDVTCIAELLRKVSGSYTTYFNKKYTRVGHLFQGVYKASRITSDPYLLHISRYIHRNPKDYNDWQYSSLPYYLKGWNADWINTAKILELFEEGSYSAFVADTNDAKIQFEDIKYELADT